MRCEELAAMVSGMAVEMREQRFTGKKVLVIDARDGGIASVRKYEANKVPQGGVMLITGNGADILEAL